MGSSGHGLGTVRDSGSFRWRLQTERREKISYAAASENSSEKELFLVLQSLCCFSFFLFFNIFLLNIFISYSFEVERYFKSDDKCGCKQVTPTP